MENPDTGAQSFNYPFKRKSACNYPEGIVSLTKGLNVRNDAFAYFTTTMC